MESFLENNWHLLLIAFLILLAVFIYSAIKIKTKIIFNIMLVALFIYLFFVIKIAFFNVGIDGKTLYNITSHHFMNFIFFIPLGIFCKYFFGKKLPLIHCIIAGILASLLIEYLQVLSDTLHITQYKHVFMLDDVFYNSLGFATGAIMTIIIKKIHLVYAR